MTAINIDTATKFFVYRWFDVDGVLLYIGVTYHLQRRAAAHAQTSEWYQFADHCTSETVEGRWGHAEQVEIAAIASERPVFNVQGNDSGAADRRASYLAAHPLMPKPKSTRRRYGPKPSGDARTQSVRVVLSEAEKARVVEWTYGTNKRMGTVMREALMAEVDRWERAEKRRSAHD